MGTVPQQIVAALKCERCQSADSQTAACKIEIQRKTVETVGFYLFPARLSAGRAAEVDSEYGEEEHADTQNKEQTK